MFISSYWFRRPKGFAEGFATNLINNFLKGFAKERLYKRKALRMANDHWSQRTPRLVRRASGCGERRLFDMREE